MHAFLLIGKDQSLLETEIQKLAKKLKIRIISHELKKIEQVRNLNDFTKLKVDKPTGIVLRNIDTATTESLNAILKNLEEPQKDLYYIITAGSEYKIIPTITSRCQVIKISKSRSKNQSLNYSNGADKNLQTFLNSKVGNKLAFLSTLRKKDETITFLQKVIIYLHNNLTAGNTINKNYADLLKITQNTLNSVNKNGNIALQLTHFAIALSRNEVK